MTDETFAGEPLDPHALHDELARLRTDIERLTREMDEARQERDAFQRWWKDGIAHVQLCNAHAEKAEDETLVAERKVEKLRKALSRAIEGWEDGASYKTGYLREKHGDDEGIRDAKATLADTETKDV